MLAAIEKYVALPPGASGRFQGCFHGVTSITTRTLIAKPPSECGRGMRAPSQVDRGNRSLPAPDDGGMFSQRRRSIDNPQSVQRRDVGERSANARAARLGAITFLAGLGSRRRTPVFRGVPTVEVR